MSLGSFIVNFVLIAVLPLRSALQLAIGGGWPYDPIFRDFLYKGARSLFSVSFTTTSGFPIGGPEWLVPHTRLYAPAI